MKTKNALRTLIALVVVFWFGTPSYAATLHDESADGDLSNSFSSPTSKGALPLGTSSLSGSLPGSLNGDNDWLTFDISPGTQLASIVLTTWVDSGPFGNVPLAVNFPTTTNATFVTASNIGLDLLPSLTGGPVGAGTYLFGVRTGQETISSYQFNFTVDSISVVPLPAALPLFGTGVALIGLIGWRRSRAAFA